MPKWIESDPNAENPKTDMTYRGHKDAQVIHANFIEYPLAADCVPGSEGAAYPASKAAKHVFIKLGMLKTGDEIVGYRLLGRVTSGGNAVTVDAALMKVPKAGTPADPTGDASNAITQVSKTAAYTMDEAATFTAPYTVVTDETYNVDINVTTGAGCTAIIHGVELIVNRK